LEKLNKPAAGTDVAPSGGSNAQNAQAAFDANLLSQAYERTEKIRRFKEQKELDSQLTIMHAALSAPHVDEEQRRKCFNMFIKYWINKSIDDLKLITGNRKCAKNRRLP
jgi:hypothetical protein